MVECEYQISNALCRRINRFNRYMVECESLRYVEDVHNNIGFNRYMVECE